MFKKKAVEKEEAKEEAVEEVQVIEKAPTEAEVHLIRKERLESLRAALVSEGIDTIGKLDVLLSQVNERLRQLGR